MPPTLNYAAPPGTDIRQVAIRQKVIIYCILVEIVVFIARLMAPPQVQGILTLIYGVTALTALVFVFMLSTTIYSTSLGIVLGILALIPLIGLIVLLIVNGKATRILRQHGIRVGLMGADPKQITSPGQIGIR